MNKRIAIVATSPLQIMLAHNICEIYKPSYVKCYILTYDGDNRYDKCKRLAEDYGYEVQASQLALNRWILLKTFLLSISRNKGFDFVIQGQFVWSYYYLFSLGLLRNGGELIVTDDGTSTFGLQDEKLMNSLMKSPFLKFIFSLMGFRKIHHNLYYTIFKGINSKYFKIKDLSILSIDTNDYPNGVYFLGTFQEAYISSYIPQMTNIQFNNLIAETIKYIDENFRGEEIVYIPHGREFEKNNYQICKRWNLHYLPSEVSVEVDFPKKGYYPKIIIGFMSTALFTLKAMYPSAQVFDVRPINLEYKYPDTIEKMDFYENAMNISRVYLNI